MEIFFKKNTRLLQRWKNSSKEKNQFPFNLTYHIKLVFFFSFGVCVCVCVAESMSDNMEEKKTGQRRAERFRLYFVFCLVF